MRVVLVEDERNSREVLEQMLQLFCPQVKIVATADSVQSAYKVVVEEKPDLVFLDIQIGGGTGFDLLSLFDELSFQVIFTTAFQEYAIRAFQFSAVDYLLKPISPEYLVKAVNKVEKLNKASVELQTLLQNVTFPEEKRIVIKTHDRVYSIFVKDIVRCESDSSYTTVFLNDGQKIVVAKQLKEFDEMLSPYSFVRIHQSHLVNNQMVFYFQKRNNMLIMKDKS